MDVSSRIRIRSAEATDAPGLLDIYRPFVEETATSFELEAPDVDEFAGRIKKASGRWCWLVAQDGERLAGYAYASAHRERPAYGLSVEVSVYVHPSCQRGGVGRSLYGQLFQELASLGYCNAFAGIALPNESSVGFHCSVGFEVIGTFKRVGRKFGVWHDAMWLQRALREEPLPSAS